MGRLCPSIDHQPLHSSHRDQMLEINLANNLLTFVPSNLFSSFSGHQITLGLEGNPITSIAADAFTGASSAIKVEVDMTNNQLTTLPADLFRNTGVNNFVITFQRNPLTSLPPTLFHNISFFVGEFLFISCPLTSMGPPGLFQGSSVFDLLPSKTAV
eukprot:m.188591 g.188591  ORF g.188591 m.188591 type:complete len:157 (+) comp15086_c0_seq1:738-1208(+)